MTIYTNTRKSSYSSIISFNIRIHILDRCAMRDSRTKRITLNMDAEFSPADVQNDRSSGLSLMQLFCVVDNYVPGFAPMPLPLAWFTHNCRLIYCKIILLKKWFLNIFPQKNKTFDTRIEPLTGIEPVVLWLLIVERLTWFSYGDSTL